jgi:hypothetical protein
MFRDSKILPPKTQKKLDQQRYTAEEANMQMRLRLEVGKQPIQVHSSRAKARFRLFGSLFLGSLTLPL